MSGTFLFSIQQFIGGLWNWVVNNPASFSQLLFSGALVAVTLAYTKFTKDQTEEMEKTRKVSNQPVVKGGFGLIGPINMTVLIQNTGNSPAHNVNGKVYFKDTDVEPYEFHIPVLSTDDEYEFGLPQEGGEGDGFLLNTDQIQDLIEKHDSEGIVVVEADFENPFGEEYYNESELDVPSFIDNKSQIIRDSEEQKIRKGIEGISDSIGDMAKNINTGPNSKLSDHRLYTEVLDIITEHEEIRFNELRYLTGIDEKALRDIVSSLEQGGIVRTPEEGSLFSTPDLEITYLGKDVDLRAGIPDSDLGEAIELLESQDYSEHEEVIEDEKE